MIIKNIRKSLTLRWMVFSIVIAILPMAIAGFSIIRTYQENLKRSVIEIEKDKAQMVVEKTRGFLERVTSNLLFLSRDEHFRRGDHFHIKNYFRNLLSQKDYLVELTLLNEKGVETVKVSRYKEVSLSELKDRSRTDMFRVASKGRTYYGDFDVTQEGIPTMVIAVSIEGERAKPSGILAVQIHLQSVWNVISETRIGEKGFAYVVDSEGTLISHPDIRRVLMKINMRHFPMVNEVVAGKEGNLEFEYPRGEKFLFVFRPIEDLGWGVVVQVPVQEAYEPIEKVTYTALGWMGVSLFVSVIFSLLLMKKWVRPIKQLSHEMTKVSKGNLDVHMKPITQDEIGLLTNSFNQMVQDLRTSREALIEAEAKYRRIFENSKDMIYITSVDGRFVDFNRAALEMLGYQNKEELKQVYVRDTYFYPEDRKRFQNEITRKGFVKDFEVKLRRKDGTPMDCLITASVRKEEEGIIIGYEGIIKDISYRKNFEKELEVVNNINKILASSLDVRRVIKTLHAEFKRVLDSERMAITLLEGKGVGFRYFASEKEDGAPEPIDEEIYPKDGTPFSKAMETEHPVIVPDTLESDSWVNQRLCQEGIRSSLVFPLEYKGRIIGTINFGSWKANHFTEDHIRFLQQVSAGLAISIENSLLLDEMRSSEERYRTVVESAHDGVLVVGEDYRFKYVNERLAEILGYSRVELVGTDFRDYLDESSRQLVADRYLRRQRGEEVPARYEFNVLRKDGEIRNVEISSNIMQDSKGHVNTIAFIKDITEKKRMEEQLIQNEKLRALGEMASGVAHDFNNALAAILGNTQLLLYTVKEEDFKETLRIMEKVAKDSAQTVRRLQDFTRKGVHKEFFKLDVNALIKDAVEITRPKWKDDAQGRGIQIEIITHFEEIPPVAGNTSELREVITNMIFNAIEAMPKGGKIEIRTFCRKEKVYIQVSDTGIGMTEAVRKKVFEPFFTTKPFTNTGLGLSMSYGIIKRFGGEIEVESHLGQGATFTIILPGGFEGEEELAAPALAEKGREARILVIDDEESVRSVLSRILSQLNHHVTVAKDGGEGLQLLKEKEFDIVLTDLGMPGMSGWEVCKAIKEISSQIPVGMITGWGMELNQTQKEESGLDFIISKPFDLHQILKLVNETIESRKKRFLS